MKEQLLEATAKTFENEGHYKGYPIDRLVMTDSDFDSDDDIEIPEGPWHMPGDDLPSTEESRFYRDAGYKTDTLGRPLHPWVKEMITNPNVGVVTGRGAYWNWGPNFTADPIVITRGAQPRVLVIQRGDTGKWAIPGGFKDPGDPDALAAGRRELREEAGLDTDAEATLIYEGPVADLRATAHAWPETSAYLMQIDKPVPVVAGDDAKDAKWMRVDKIRDFHGSHAVLIEEARKQGKYEQKESIPDMLAHMDELGIEIVDAGHMAYDHFFVRDGANRIFVKKHDASRFTDMARELHSREYLEKEFAIYDHLGERVYDYIPERVDLVDDSLLAMDALHVNDGWLWRAPEDSRLDAYITDVLQAFDQLQLVPIPKDPDYHEGIEETYTSFWQEGWDDITHDKVDAIIAKARSLSVNWTEEQKSHIESMIADLPSLREQAAAIQRDVPMFMAHNDARQANIAWHQDHGAKIVDWSWGDPAPKDADKTMFLTDLVKSDIDVTPYLEHLNKDYLILQIGFYLGHSLWQTHDGSTTVREQQVASAAAAHELLRKLQNL